MSEFNRSEWLNRNELAEYAGFMESDNVGLSRQLSHIFGAPEIAVTESYTSECYSASFTCACKLWRKSTVDEILEDMM